MPLSTSQRAMYERYLADHRTQQSLQRAVENRIFPVEVGAAVESLSNPYLAPI